MLAYYNSMQCVLRLKTEELGDEWIEASSKDPKRRRYAGAAKALRDLVDLTDETMGDSLEPER